MNEPPMFSPPARNMTFISPSTAEMLDACPHAELNEVGQAFISSENLKVLGPAYLELILARRKLIIFEELSRLEMLNPSKEDFEWFYTHKHNVEYDLLSKNASSLTPAQNAVRFGLVSYTFGTVLKKQRSTYAYSQVLTGQLKRCLDLTDMKSLWEPNVSLLMWQLLMGAHGATNKPERPWYVLQLARCFDKLGFVSLDEPRKVLLGYFYLERIHGGSLEEMWNESSLLRLVNADD